MDILVLDKKKKKGLFVECKFRNRPMAMEEYDDLATAAKGFPELKEKKLLFISKGGFTESVKKRAGKEGAELLGLKDLFAV